MEKQKDTEGTLAKQSLCIGVDGCRGGWIVAVYDYGTLKIEKQESIYAIIEQYPHFERLLIDMVMGLASNHTHIRPETEARKLIPGRAATIFAAPSRQAVYARTEKEQIETNKAALGKSLSKQTMAIIPKMRELDEFLNVKTEYKNILKESHPEVCFASLNGSVVMSKKAKPEGIKERIDILKKYIPELKVAFVMKKAKILKCNPDDIVDAICLAVAANLDFQGKSEMIPANPMADDMGILMRLVSPKLMECQSKRY